MSYTTTTIEKGDEMNKGFWYLASPYNNYDGGEDRAFEDACVQTALLYNRGIPTYSPIVHNHSVEKYLRKGHDYEFWLTIIDLPMMDAACGIIVCKLKGWRQSKGINKEVEIFRLVEKPIVFMDPWNIPEEFGSEYE